MACTIQEKLSVLEIFENEHTLITALSVCLYNIAGDFISTQLNVFKIDMMLCIFHNYEVVFFTRRH